MAAQFLDQATTGCDSQNLTLTIGSPKGTKNPIFQNILQSASEALGEDLEPIGGNLTKALESERFEGCIRWLIDAAPLPDTMECFIMMARNHQITSWSIEGVAMPTESSLNEIYGTLPTVQPMFSFQTRPQYEYVKSVAHDLGYFTMNDTHLKEA